MRKLIFLGVITLMVYCKSKPVNQTTDWRWYDSIPFGTVQPHLQGAYPSDNILRIDSLVQYDSSYSIYFVTTGGNRVLRKNGKFSTLVIKGYKADGSHSCVGATIFADRTVNYCKDSACTIVIDSTQLSRTKRPYPILHPEKDNAKDTCY